jgi:hypothetical protein
VAFFVGALMLTACYSSKPRQALGPKGPLLKKSPLEESGTTATPTLIVLKNASNNTATSPVANNDIVSPTDTPTEVSTDTPTEPPTDTPTDTPTMTVETVVDTPTDTPTEVAQETPTFTPTMVPEENEVEISEAPITDDKKAGLDKTKRLGLSPTWFDYLVQAGYLVKKPRRSSDRLIVESSTKTAPYDGCIL